MGGKQALFNAALALFDPGDEVITHAPCWPTIPEQVKLMGATPVIVSGRADDGFAVHADAIVAAMSSKTKAVILNSPCNPTGALIDEGTVAAIADAAAARGVWLIVDLCYEQLVYDPVPHNLPKVLFGRHRNRTVLAGSASKGCTMTGWRCGWSIAPKELTAALSVIQGQSTSNITSITQKAALAAIKGPQDAVFDMLDEYRRRRDSIHGWLAAHPAIRCVKPKGAFYLLPDISGLLSPDGIRTSAEFAQALIEREQVVVVPGEAFEAPGYVRILVRDFDGAITRRGDSDASLRGVAAAIRSRRTDLMVSLSVRQSIADAVGAENVRADESTLAAYAADALGQGHLPDLVVLPQTATEIARLARSCTEHGVPLVVRGAGTGYTGGAVPTRGGIVVSLERMNRILEIDEVNLLAVVEPNVINGDLQRAVERVGLSYPPDPASLESSTIGGNVAECAGGPRAFKVRDDQAVRAGPRSRAAYR